MFLKLLRGFQDFLASIQICRSLCKSVSIYVIAGVGLGAGVDLGVEACPGSKPGEPDPGEPEVAEPNVLAGLLPFAVVLLSCVIAPISYTVVLLGVESLSGSLETAEPYSGFS